MSFNDKFHNFPSVLLALAFGGLIALAKELAVGVIILYRYALTSQGLAALVVASLILSTATLIVSMIRR